MCLRVRDQTCKPVALVDVTVAGQSLILVYAYYVILPGVLREILAGSDLFVYALGTLIIR